MTKSEIMHGLFTVALFSLVFRGASDPLGVTAMDMASGIAVLFVADRFVRHHATR